MSFDLSEITRRLYNLIRPGTIAQADHAAGKVRCQIGSILTTWLPWLTHRAGPDSTWHAPEIGEQVLILSPGGDFSQGFVLPAIYQNDHPQPETDPDLSKLVFSDGSFIEYDRAAHRYTVAISNTGAEIRLISAGKITLSADSDLTIEAGGQIDIEASGNLNLKGAQIHLQ
jgi:phage baseplate assembly protein V